MKFYSEFDMLNRFRTVLGVNPHLTLPGVGERRAFDSDLIEELHDRYRHILATEPRNLLPVEDIGGEIEKAHCFSRDMMWIKLPRRCVRLVSVYIPGWKSHLCLFYPPCTQLYRRQRIDFLRATEYSPLAFSSVHGVEIYGIPKDYAGEPLKVMAICEPKDGGFMLDESLLPLMLKPDFFSEYEPA